MDPSKRNGKALENRIDELCDRICKSYSAIFGVASKPAAGNVAEMATNEYRIKEESLALVEATQNLSTLIRDLQELWLFGSLDTIISATDEQANREKAMGIARQIEALVKVESAAAGIGEGPGQQGQKQEQP